MVTGHPGFDTVYLSDIFRIQYFYRRAGPEYLMILEHDHFPRKSGGDVQVVHGHDRRYRDLENTESTGGI